MARKKKLLVVEVEANKIDENGIKNIIIYLYWPT